MLKSLILVGVFAAAYAGVVHDGGDSEGYETAHHSDIDHKHATSHQSFKIHHFHAVPVYVKKEDQKYLKHPVEIGGLKHKLKILHPEAQHAKGYGLTLENHGEVHHKIIGEGYGGHSYDLGSAGSENMESNGGGGDYHYHDINVHEEQQ